MATRILIADDHDIVIEGVRTLVAKSGRPWEIVGEARNGKEAIDMIRSLSPDVAILDITMPVMSGLEAARQLSRAGNRCRMLMFTMHESGMLGVEARESGAQGYVLKSRAARDLIRAIDYLVEGSTFFGAPPPDVSAKDEKKNDGIKFFLNFAFA